MNTKLIKEVKFPRWLANVAVVEKKNGKLRVRVDFTNLSKARPKDQFNLPHIDSFIYATVGQEILTIIDASAEFQQIQTEPSYQEDTTFINSTCIYCYITMPFGLKNAGATYQSLENKMYKHQLGKIIEVYIDHIVIKSKKAENHLEDLEETFNILDPFNMKINPSKSHFGVKSSPFENDYNQNYLPDPFSIRTNWVR